VPFRSPWTRAEKATIPKSRGGTKATDISQTVRALTGWNGDIDIGGDGRPLPRPAAWTHSQFGPNWPLPAEPLDLPRPDTGQAEPRIYQYPVAWNLQYFNDRPVDWEVLRKAADSPLFRACIELRKTEVAALEWTFDVDDATVEQIARRNRSSSQDAAQNLREKYREEIQRLNDFWAKPDRRNGHDFEAWIKLMFEEQLVWDALSIYPRLTYGGQLNDFLIIDGSTIKPLLDETGGRPEPPAPAFQQILYGFPRGEFTADEVELDGKKVVPAGLDATQLVYRRRVVRTRSPYGFSPTEQALLDGMLYNARFRWMLAEYTEGTQPLHFLVNKDPAATDWTASQVLEYEHAYNERFSGQTAERFRVAMPPPGYEPYVPTPANERYKADYDLHLIKLGAMHYGVTVTELGFAETGSLGSTGYHEGQEDVLYRKTRLPDIRHAQRLITELSQSFLGCPPEVKFKFLGLEQEDEAAAEAVARSKVESGRKTLNEDRLDNGNPRFDFAEADMPMMMTQRGIVFIKDASKQAPGGVLIEPASEKIDDPSAPGGTATDTPTARRPLSPGGGRAAAQKELAQARIDELAAFGKWARKRPEPGRKFQFEHITKEQAAEFAPDLLKDARVAFKASGPGPKVPVRQAAEASAVASSPLSSGPSGPSWPHWSPYSQQRL
jgi:hypothetical protein